MNKVEITLGSRALTIKFFEHVGQGKYYLTRSLELHGDEPIAEWAKYFLATGKVPKAALLACL